LTRTYLPVSVISGQSLTRCHHRQLFTGTPRLQQEEAGAAEEDEEKEDETSSTKVGTMRRFVDVETSIGYINSKAFKITYGDALVWESYRRNFKGPRPRRKTRITCIRNGVLATGNPCPICRDEYLTVDPKNTELLKQFVSPQTGLVLSYEKTGVCQQQYKNLLIAVQQAWDLGYLEMPLPNRRYNYADYYPEFKRKKQPARFS
ncbi:hypothetical protein LSH36_59g00019, partial [Paralvinella palmiformis]